MLFFSLVSAVTNVVANVTNVTNDDVIEGAAWSLVT